MFKKLNRDIEYKKKRKGNKELIGQKEKINYVNTNQKKARLVGYVNIK